MKYYRIEKDSLGEIKVPADKYWGANTQRSLQNFEIGSIASMPFEVIEAFAYIKKASAITNNKQGLLSERKKELILQVCDEIIAGELKDHFPLVIWQTGSGTHTNMNCNEVISNRAQVLSGNQLGSGKNIIHPNDDVNMSQSSNDTFSSAMHIAAYKKTEDYLLPKLRLLRDALDKKSEEFWEIIKVGRTHFMDAVPIRLGQEFSGYTSQIDYALKTIENTIPDLTELCLGGTAVGTGLNTVKGYDEEVVRCISELTDISFRNGKNKFALLASHDAIVKMHGSLKQLAVSLMKITHDIRMLASGPKTGLNELILPANEAGSSIMPGKTNPTQIEAITMVCTRVLGNDVTISIANSNGYFELNVYKPVIIATLLESITLLSDSCKSFTQNCLSGITANTKTLEENLEKSLMLATVLTPYIGYENAGTIAKKAFQEDISLKKAGIELGLVTADQYDQWVVPAAMTEPAVK